MYSHIALQVPSSHSLLLLTESFCLCLLLVGRWAAAGRLMVSVRAMATLALTSRAM